ncbi:peptidyl-tRNA hydrolase 2, putative [Plasmodium berghei]|uniref:peptidyl-tRNA hydrolase n=2 Tax=Plasmodium berghei TaxID=5821 RepID=A0A509AJE5_PLABA|nr:peptidyl-tRNA hydrolase 2, putative [Plasmodium berghei ANKA]CXI49381.1 peptidyl-tRNA hydrolase 2, putative [Plasmodium berghei]SCL94008.1 peptidyl-tRNA hydrolase 2, putative [Plasmodium berghei]SCM15923.1 peptidyl-tRNA hydrolase 2, putative [Plasmodium berghei]SCM17719.1 peptidyl-tRNA hydrolase 2, putative [Plasmodium berghei]SCN25893.1 peptidyl-tRNA hydrolase 2, putative [Plasmodium berghei]|eukprot:XP_034421848.1 peptidyl-tRNA hydrolase 2, putative [Plasmodium berghei ANKA]
MNSDINGNITNLENDSYRMIVLVLTFLCGFILGLCFKCISQIQKNASKVRDIYESISACDNDCKMVFCVRTDIKMNKGKIASQCCHACLDVYEKILKRNRKLKANEHSKNVLTYYDIWKKNGQKKIVLKISSLEEMYEIEKKAKMDGLITSIIVDAGRTQIEPNTETVIAIEPVPDEIVNKITGQLKLL